MKSLAHVCEQVYGRPWIIRPEAHASVRTLIETRLGGAIPEPEAARPEKDFLGDEIPKLMIQGQTAIVPIHGIIGSHLGRLAKSCGAVGTEDIEEDIGTAILKGCKRIIFDINSPGGMVNGTPELGDKIASLRSHGIETHSFVDGQCCSAAYWLAAGTDKIYATRSADVGSIGVYIALLDESERFSREGLRVDVVKAGDLKGLGVRGTALTEEQRAHLQERVDEIYSMFSAHVKSHRRVSPDSMQGQSFLAAQALSRGLIDELIGDFSDLFHFDRTLNPATTPGKAKTKLEQFNELHEKGDPFAAGKFWAEHQEEILNGR
jgi:signal peptide peptidase SppA